MDKAKLAVLEAELNSHKQEIEKIYAKIKLRAANLGDEAAVESLGYQLHNLYCAYEELFQAVAEAFENNVEKGLTWHKELLRRMSVTIEGIRPKLISEEALQLVSELRAFRHFFRHAYAYELDRGKIKFVLEKALKLKNIFLEDLAIFLTELKKGML